MRHIWPRHSSVLVSWHRPFPDSHRLRRFQVIVPFRALGPLNRLTHILSQRSPNLLFDKLIRRWRSNTLGLPACSNINYRSMLTLYSYSPHVIPVPSDWNENVLVTGYWFLDSPISSKLPDPLSASPLRYITEARAQPAQPLEQANRQPSAHSLGINFFGVCG